VNESIQDEGMSKLFVMLNKIIIEKQKPLIYPLLRIAVVMVILITIYFIVKICILNDLDGQLIYKNYYSKYQPDILCRSSDTNLSVLNTALNYYESGEYLHCINLLDSMLIIDKRNYLSCFFLGLSYLELDSLVSAINTFKYIPYNWDSPYSIHRDWYLGLSFARLGNYEESIILMEKLYLENGYYAKNAKRIIHQLKFLISYISNKQ
jgi:hypothetical protein